MICVLGFVWNLGKWIEFFYINDGQFNEYRLISFVNFMVKLRI